MRIVIAPLAVLLLLSCQTTDGVNATAQLIIEHATIWTGDDEHPTAQAIAIRDGVIVSVGDSDSIAKHKGPLTKTLSLPGRFIMPGFIDGHVHPLGAGRQHQGCSVQGLTSVKAIQDKAQSCDIVTRKDTEDRGGWVFGRGFDLSLFPGANPHKKLLDDVVADRPVYFRGEDGHSGWANSLALKIAGITKDTKDPPQGVIERDSDGTPSGTLRESAIDLLETHLPKPSLTEDIEAMRWAQHELLRHGITSIMDGGVDQRRLEAYAALAAKDELTLDVMACVVVEADKPTAALTLARDLRARFSGHAKLRVTCTKIYLDGVLEGDTAALLEPYHNHKDATHKGTLNATQEQLNETVALLEKDGFFVHMHVIGDGAVRAALNAYQAHDKGNGLAHRGTLAHLQLVHDDDAARFAALGISANAQSLWAYPDTYILDINLPQVGKERVERMYPWGTLKRAQARIVGGSDWPVSSVNPLDAIEVMVTRSNPREKSEKVLGATRKEALDKDSAFRAYTVEAASLVFGDAAHKSRAGIIKKGARADLVVLTHNLNLIDDAAINDATVALTIKNGVVVYDARTP